MRFAVLLMAAGILAAQDYQIHSVGNVTLAFTKQPMSNGGFDTAVVALVATDNYQVAAFSLALEYVVNSVVKRTTRVVSCQREATTTLRDGIPRYYSMIIYPVETGAVISVFTVKEHITITTQQVRPSDSGTAPVPGTGTK